MTCNSIIRNKKNPNTLKNRVVINKEQTSSGTKDISHERVGEKLTLYNNKRKGLEFSVEGRSFSLKRKSCFSWIKAGFNNAIYRCSIQM